MKMSKKSQMMYERWSESVLNCVWQILLPKKLIDVEHVVLVKYRSIYNKN